MTITTTEDVHPLEFPSFVTISRHPKEAVWINRPADEPTHELPSTSAHCRPGEKDGKCPLFYVRSTDLDKVLREAALHLCEHHGWFV